MSYLDASGRWQAGFPPSPADFKRTLDRVGKGGLDLSEGTPPQQPQRRPAALDMSDAAVRERSDALLEEMAEAGLETGAITPSPSDATLGLEDSGQRAAAADAADELLEEMRRHGLLGGDVA